jgi:uroporphyrinogen decarboxylase
MPGALRPDTMSTPQRFMALLMGQKPDRVPFSPFIFAQCARNVGYPVSAIFDNAQTSFFAQLWSAELYGYDGSPMYGYASYGAWEFGGEVRMPQGPREMAPVVLRHPVQNEKDVEEILKVRPDFEKSGCNPISLEFGRMQASFGMPVTCLTGGAFTMVGNLCGVDNLSRWMIRRPELVHKMLRHMVDYLVDLVKFWGDTFGWQMLQTFTGDPTSSNQVISPKQFQEFVLPYQRELNQKTIDMGVKSLRYHICGEQNANLPHWAQIPFGGDGIPGQLSFGHEVDLDDAIKWLGENNVIAGNVNPTIILQGTPQEVYDECVKAIEKGKKAPKYHFMLMSGCEVPLDAPPYNIYTMQKAVREHGWYD